MNEKCSVHTYFWFILKKVNLKGSILPVEGVPTAKTVPYIFVYLM